MNLTALTTFAVTSSIKNDMLKINAAFLAIIIFVLGCSTPNNETKKELERLKEIANKHYEQRDFSKAYNDYAELVKLDSSNGEFHFRKGRAAASLKLYEDARDSFMHSIEKKYKEADSYYNLGLTYLFKNNLLATRYFKECLKIDPNHRDAFLALNSIKQSAETQ